MIWKFYCFAGAESEVRPPKHKRSDGRKARTEDVVFIPSGKNGGHLCRQDEVQDQRKPWKSFPNFFLELCDPVYLHDAFRLERLATWMLGFCERFCGH